MKTLAEMDIKNLIWMTMVQTENVPLEEYFEQFEQLFVDTFKRALAEIVPEEDEYVNTDYEEAKREQLRIIKSKIKQFFGEEKSGNNR